MWTEGTIQVGTSIFHYWVKHYEEPSTFGYEEGRASKISLRRNGKTVFNFDRGMDIPPEDEETETYASTRDRDVADAEHALRALRDLTSDNDEQMPHNGKIKLSAILGGDMLGGQWFRKQFWFIVTLTAMLIVYISNRYYCQQEMLETKALSDTLLDRRYKALTRSSQLKEKTRRSYIEESLVDTTLQTANTPSFNLKIE